MDLPINTSKRPYQRRTDNRPTIYAPHQVSSYDEKQSIQLRNSPFVPQKKIIGGDHKQGLMLKRPRNAYNIFVQSQSVRIKEGNPHMRAPDIVRIAAERYNSMNEEQKRPYVQRFEQAKRIFDSQQMSSGNRLNNQIPRRGRGSRGAKYDYTLK